MNAAQTKTRRRRRLWRRPQKRADTKAAFIEHLPLIERVAESACRRAGLPPQEAEDFASRVKVKLIDDDYAVLRKHRGDSRLSTYLTTVIHNQFKDYCNHKWGKFRYSAAAERLGADAKALERLLVIDGYELEPAIEILKRNHQVETSRRELREFAARLPRRRARQFVGEEALAQRASEAPEADAERRVADGERAAAAARVEEVLQTALETLSAQDLLVLKMYYRDGYTVASIAAALRLEARPLYTRREKCHAALRAAFESRGLTWDDVRDILGWQGRGIRADFGPGDSGEDDLDGDDRDKDEKNRDGSV